MISKKRILTIALLLIIGVLGTKFCADRMTKTSEDFLEAHRDEFIEKEGTITDLYIVKHYDENSIGGDRELRCTVLVDGEESDIRLGYKVTGSFIDSFSIGDTITCYEYDGEIYPSEGAIITSNSNTSNIWFFLAGIFLCLIMISVLLFINSMIVARDKNSDKTENIS